MEIFAYFREVQARLIDEYHLLPHGDKDDEYESNKLNLLIANPHGIFGMLSMREVYEYKKFWAMGSADDFAMGARFAVYDSAKEIAEIGVRAGIEFDDGSSGPVISHIVELAG